MLYLPRLILCGLLVLSILVPGPGTGRLAALGPAPGPEAGDAEARQALAAATRDLCDKDVALLGENGFHGDGKTIAFKSALVRNLVRKCRFNAVYFEASHYDFLEIARRFRAGRPVSPEMLSSALGGVWNRNEEIAPLVAFLHAQATAGRLTLGGLDDQLGGRGMFYSLDEMPAELTSYLTGARREECRALLRHRIWSDFPRNAPYGEAARERLRRCLNDVGSAVAVGAARADREALVQILANIERFIGRDFIEGNERIWKRDEAMYLNLRWLAGRSKRPRIIVWASNSHVAKDAGALSLYAGGHNLGSRVRRAYGDRAFALGFTAASGSFRYTVRTARPIPVAPPGSLEALALAGGNRDAVYVGSARLAALGLVRGAAFDDHQHVPARWARVHDGIVVFPAERPPKRTDE